MLELIHRDVTTIYTHYDLHLSWYTEMSPRYIHVMIYTWVDTQRCHHDRYTLWFTLQLIHRDFTTLHVMIHTSVDTQRCHHDRYTLWFTLELIQRRHHVRYTLWFTLELIHRQLDSILSSLNKFGNLPILATFKVLQPCMKWGPSILLYIRNIVQTVRAVYSDVVWTSFIHIFQGHLIGTETKLSCDCPGVNVATLKNMGKDTWIVCHW